MSGSSPHKARAAKRLLRAFLAATSVIVIQAAAACAAPERVGLASMIVAEPFFDGDPRQRARWLGNDGDGDGLSNRIEARRTPTNPQRFDSDGDGLSDGAEAQTIKTNPRRADSDGDGFGDGLELLVGSDPWDPASTPEVALPAQGGQAAPAPTPDPGPTPSLPEGPGDPGEDGPGPPPPPDTMPPNTTIGSGPPLTTTSTGASFSFSSSEAGSSFECKLDGGAFGACTPAKSYLGLAVGDHRFEVRATDAAQNTDPTPASWEWTIEEPPPPPPPLPFPSACEDSDAVDATTAVAVRAAAEDGEDVCVVATLGNVDLGDLGSTPVMVSTEGGSMGAVDLGSTTDLTISRARFRSVTMRNSHQVSLLGNTIGGTPSSRVEDQLIFMPETNNDVRIEGNDIGWTVADNSGNTGYGCRCYGTLNGLRFVGNKLHDLAADGFQGVGGSNVLIDRNEIGPVGANPDSSEHSDNIQITGNGNNLRITNNWIHHQGYYEGLPEDNAGSTYIHGGSSGSLIYENNLVETNLGRTEICGLGTGGSSRSNITIRRNTWVDGGKAFTGFPGFEWDCSSGSGNLIERNVAIDPDGGFAGAQSAATFSSNLFGQPSLVTLDGQGNCTSANCNPAGAEPIGYRKPSGVGW